MSAINLGRRIDKLEHEAGPRRILVVPDETKLAGLEIEEGAIVVITGVPRDPNSYSANRA